jgi:hypothetical protein
MKINIYKQNQPARNGRVEGCEGRRFVNVADKLTHVADKLKHVADELTNAADKEHGIHKKNPCVSNKTDNYVGFYVLFILW